MFCENVQMKPANLLPTVCIQSGLSQSTILFLLREAIFPKTMTVGFVMYFFNLKEKYSPLEHYMHIRSKN